MAGRQRLRVGGYFQLLVSGQAQYGAFDQNASIPLNHRPQAYSPGQWVDDLYLIVGLGNLGKEFLPDIKRKVLHRK